jgi:hypothetical protein
MEKRTLLQSFAINNLGELVSVRQVERGKACNCCCPGCGEVVIARQGEVRTWHFAHESGADCEGGAESALHLAAKQIILREAIVMTPAVEATAHRTLPDGRRGSGAAFLAAAHHNLRGVQLEAPVGVIRPDVLAYTDAGSLIVEIAVTHPVDQEKATLLEQTGIAAMEIELIPDLFQEWTWESLKEAVINDPLNRHWLYHPEMARLAREAEGKALAAAEAAPLTQQAMSKRSRLSVKGVPTYLSEYPWGFSVWYPYNDQTYAVVKTIAARFGGRWKPKYRNWAFPPGVREAVEAELRALGAVDCRS